MNDLGVTFSALRVARSRPHAEPEPAKTEDSLSFDNQPAISATQGNQFQRDLVALIPHLRAFSRSMCSRRELADDLAQDALMKAWRARDSYHSGTNLKAWLFTILRNTVYSHNRRAWRESQFEDGVEERIEAPDNEQGWTAELCDTTRALRTLPDAQRDAVILIGAGGFTYKEAAKICNTNSGTMKSRVARGRAALLSAVNNNTPIGPNSSERALKGSDGILAQMSALTSARASRAARM
jgi:RNA polymerase sigma-70 factor (ECF subfamily)